MISKNENVLGQRQWSVDQAERFRSRGFCWDFSTNFYKQFNFLFFITCPKSATGTLEEYAKHVQYHQSRHQNDVSSAVQVSFFAISRLISHLSTPQSWLDRSIHCHYSVAKMFWASTKPQIYLRGSSFSSIVVVYIYATLWKFEHSQRHFTWTLTASSVILHVPLETGRTFA